MKIVFIIELNNGDEVELPLDMPFIPGNGEQVNYEVPEDTEYNKKGDCCEFVVRDRNPLYSNSVGNEWCVILNAELTGDWGMFYKENDNAG